ncbi:tannase/feruloyl esterase family alpha/beta hydrolase [Derxia gummosa]|uniref:Tannase/feruloyl esterase family alpha/beta hydrolase n=1 Tax=Derxia gummosa DSM 723 TaxID=1121388 RepID=A0A8B6X3S5_9BURK|nr:tannase/feruloyl esterase family alpha/beta hydrolase [Derxia gummosa]
MKTHFAIPVALAGVLGLAGCGSDDSSDAASVTKLACGEITTAALGITGLTVTATETVAAGTVTPSGADSALPQHCRVTGSIDPHTSPVDGKAYAIGFELRLPTDWNGRFMFQGGGGTDGVVNPAYGNILGGGPTTNALTRGFAVASTDGGHTTESAPIVGGSLFGLDPQARVDYGYNAVGRTTEIAKAVIRRFYGADAGHSYFLGCSNGGRQALVAATRFADRFDGIVAGNPGFNLPKAAVQHAWDVQAFSSVAPLDTDGKPIIASAFSNDDLNLVAAKIVEKCDALDGLADGMVNRFESCKGVFDPAELACAGDKTATCLSREQVVVLNKVFDGPRDGSGKQLYSDWPWDAGIGAGGWRVWKLGSSTTSVPNAIIATLGGGSLPYVFTTPPTRVTGDGTNVVDYLRGFSFDIDAPKIYATDLTYTTAAMTFMTPPNPSDLSKFKGHGGKLIVYHGGSDPVFSYNDTRNWYAALAAANSGDASGFARLFAVPGMNHCSGGPATDKFDMLAAIVDWVEGGKAPDSIAASARAANTAAAAFPTRTRPLCAWPKVAVYKGSGDVEAAASFSCQ